MLKRCVLRCCLKVETVEIARMSAGSWFHAYGAANENDLEPNVVRMMFPACRKHPCALSADEIGRQVETHAPSCQISTAERDHIPLHA